MTEYTFDNFPWSKFMSGDFRVLIEDAKLNEEFRSEVQKRDPSMRWRRKERLTEFNGFDCKQKYLIISGGDMLYGDKDITAPDAIIKRKHDDDFPALSTFKTGDIIKFEDGQTALILLDTVVGNIVRLGQTASVVVWKEDTLRGNLKGTTIEKVLRAKHITDFCNFTPGAHYEVVWEKPKPSAKKMTVAQLEEALGMAPGSLSVVKES